jgi:uncharacterized membrane protein YqjE
VANEKPLSEIVRDVMGDFQEIVRSEVRLAKTEVREEAGKAANAAKMAAAGGLLALYALGLLLLSLVWALQLEMSAWASALLVGGVLAVISVVMLNVGRKRMKTVSIKPERTIDSVKENLQWKSQ